MANIRIKDLSTDSALSAGDYVVVDSASEGSRKFDLGTEIADLKEDIGDLDDLETTDKSNLVAAINEAAQSGGGGGGGGSVDPYNSNPAALGTASPGSSAKYSRGDHVHPMPTANNVGAIAAPSSPSEGKFLGYYGGSWKAHDPVLVNPEEVTVATSGSVTSEIEPDCIFHFTGTLTALTITLAENSGHYHFDFTSGSTAVTLSLPNTVTMPDGFTVEANKRYEIDILNGYGVAQSWAVNAS